MRNRSKKGIILAIVVGGLSVLIALNFNTIKFTYSMLSIYVFGKLKIQVLAMKNAIISTT